MPAAFPVRVISPERVLFDGDAEMLACRTEVGEIAFFAHHVPLVGALDVCKLRVVPAEGASEQAFAVKGGFVEVRGNRVTVLSDVAIPVGELDSDVARDARARVESGEVDTADPAEAEAVSGAAASARQAREARWADLLEELT